MNKKDFEILKMLFEEHHRQLAAKREKIHNISERTTALLLVITGWLVVTENPLSKELKWIIIGAVFIIAGAACFTIYNNNRAYHKVKGVVRKINASLGLFKPNKSLSKETLYPEDWGKFGQGDKLKGFLPHWGMIIASAVLCIIVAVLKSK